MNRLKVLLVEDDPIIGRDIKKSLEFLGYNVIGLFNSGEEAHKAYLKEKCDVLILDIELKGNMSGIDLAKLINEKETKPTIFISGLHDSEIKLNAMNAGANAFLNKPFNERNLVNAIELAIRSSQSNPLKQAETETNTREFENNNFYVKVNKRFIKIDLTEIDFLEASGHYMVIHSGKSQYSSSISMSEFCKRYPISYFFQTHRSYIVNMNRVKDFDDTHIYFGEKMVPVSQSKQKVFKKKISIL